MMAGVASVATLSFAFVKRPTTVYHHHDVPVAVLPNNE
jgi:hypothetical protein